MHSTCANRNMVDNKEEHRLHTAWLLTILTAASIVLVLLVGHFLKGQLDARQSHVFAIIESIFIVMQLFSYASLPIESLYTRNGYYLAISALLSASLECCFLYLTFTGHPAYSMAALFYPLWIALLSYYHRIFSNIEF